MYPGPSFFPPFTAITQAWKKQSSLTAAVLVREVGTAGAEVGVAACYNDPNITTQCNLD